MALPSCLPRRSRCLIWAGGNFTALGSPWGSEPIDDRAPGISQTQKLRDFVEGLTGSVVTSVADVLVTPGVILFRSEVKMRVPARNNQGEHGENGVRDSPFAALQESTGVNVPFKMIDSDERLIERKG